MQKETKLKQKDTKTKEIEDFIFFLEENKFDSGNVRNFMKRFRLARLLRMITGLLLITAGILVIVLPMPGSVEIATLFYFTPEDGIAVSDIIALGVMLLGIILVVKDNIYYGSIIK
ncbi:MAG: hypothetical protein FMNOHCHN_01009 [Ignavibacteriaceae bacterium]|nr:hypothetical protein [Ignavibacteriaceae bacterium]